MYDVTNSALHWNVNPGVPQAWTAAAAPMRFTNNVLIAEVRRRPCGVLAASLRCPSGVLAGHGLCAVRLP